MNPKPKPTTRTSKPKPTPRAPGWRDAWDKINTYRANRCVRVYGYEYANDPHVALLMATDLKKIEGSK
jgi:hypothetical protein